MPLPPDYSVRVYAGVLGKMIGVYLGRPFEQWSHRAILDRLGTVSYYVHDKLNVSLVVADDDLTGTFTFLRALEDADLAGRELASADVAHAWLNYIVPGKSILWWGGMGVSTEHTAFVRLTSGIGPPESGSMALNGPVVAEQIGAQIFIDGFGLVSPGDPDRAARLARAAARVSHDGVAVDGAVVVAAMVAAAFSEPDVDKLIDTGLAQIPADSLLRRLVDDLRDVRARSPDWYAGLRRIHEKWSYDHFGGGCHMVPNHAVIQLALLWGGGGFSQSMSIAATAGYDTDCNLGNVGCILGVAKGLAGLGPVAAPIADANAPTRSGGAGGGSGGHMGGLDWRGPVADRLLLPTADGGTCVTDAVAVTRRVVAIARKLHRLTPEPARPRWAFELPGSVQGWLGDPAPSPEPPTVPPPPKATTDVHPATVESARGPVPLFNTGRGLSLPPGVSRVPVFISASQAAEGGSYALTACPTAHPGQRFTALLRGTGTARLLARHYTARDELLTVQGPLTPLSPSPQDADPSRRVGHTPSGSDSATTDALTSDRGTLLSLPLPDTAGQPYFDLGVEVLEGDLTLVCADILGPPDCELRLPPGVHPWDASTGRAWLRQWVNAADQLSPDGDFLQLSAERRGMALTGHAGWTDYTVSTTLKIHLAHRALLAFRIGGLERYYALALSSDHTASLIRRLNGHETVLASAPFPFRLYHPLTLTLTAHGPHLRARLDSLDLAATDPTFPTGGIAFGVESGRLNLGPLRLHPA